MDETIYYRTSSRPDEDADGEVAMMTNILLEKDEF